MGGAVSGYVLSRGAQVRKAALLAPSASMTEYSHRFARLLRLPERVRALMQAQIERRFGIRWSDFEVEVTAPRLTQPALRKCDGPATNRYTLLTKPPAGEKRRLHEACQMVIVPSTTQETVMKTKHSEVSAKAHIRESGCYAVAKSITRSKLTAALFAAGLALAAAVPASASPGPGPGMRGMTPEMTERIQFRMQARLDRMANRLEIKASQQDAWQAYTKVHKEMFDGSMKPAPKDADAAALARHRADMAAQMATKLATLADATVKLQSALTPEQAKTLADMTRHPMGGRHGKQGGRGDHSHRGQMGGMGGMGGMR